MKIKTSNHKEEEEEEHVTNVQPRKTGPSKSKKRKVEETEDVESSDDSAPKGKKNKKQRKTLKRMYPHIKPPHNANQLFVSAIYKERKEKGQPITREEVRTIWSEMKPNDKKKWQDMAQKEKDEYKQKLIEAGHSFEKVRTRAIPPFFFFAKEKAPPSSQMSRNEALKMLGETWNKMTDKAKEKYVQMYEKDKMEIEKRKEQVSAN